MLGRRSEVFFFLFFFSVLVLVYLCHEKKGFGSELTIFVALCNKQKYFQR